MDNFTPDPSYCVDIDPITWEASIYKYTEHGKQCIESFLEPDIRAEFRGFASHEFRVQPVYDHTRMVVHYRSYILEYQIADEEPTYLLLEVINNQPLFDMEANFYELAVKLSVLGDLKQPTALTFTVPDQWSITREESWEFTREINNDLTGRAYGTTIKYETTTMEAYKWIYVLFKMYSELL